MVIAVMREEGGGEDGKTEEGVTTHAAQEKPVHSQ